MALISPISDWHLSLARQVIHTGGVIAYPTEAVWGLGCNPWDRQAVERILELKQRPVEKGVILVAASVDQIRFLLDPLPPELQREAARHWPGPVTCLLPDVREQVPAWVRGQHRSIAVPGQRPPRPCGPCARPLACHWCPPPATRPAARPRASPGTCAATSAISWI